MLLNTDSVRSSVAATKAQTWFLVYRIARIPVSYCVMSSASGLYEMTVSEETILTVTIGDGSRVWKFSSCDFTIVDDVEVVALNYLNCSLRNFIIQDHAVIKQAAKIKLTCTTMRGYRDLMERRGAAQSAMSTARSAPAACTLFKPAAAKSIAKKVKNVTVTPYLVDVAFPFRGQDVTVRMKSSANNRDCISVEFDKSHPVSLHRVIGYIRDMGFEKVGVNEARIHQPDVPQGVWKRKKGDDEFFIVKRPNGKYIKCASFQEALVAKDAETVDDCEEVPSPSYNDEGDVTHPDASPAASSAPEASPLGAGTDGGAGSLLEEQRPNESDDEDDPCVITF